jgi:hypothetical protein
VVNGGQDPHLIQRIFFFFWREFAHFDLAKSEITENKGITREVCPYLL